jgi:macrolide transport system ATP-binding/permease protein
MTPPLLELHDVERRFRTGDHEVFALRGVNLAIWAGEMVAVIGASGSGKSTVLNILGCLDRPTGGTYRVAGRDIRDLGDDALAQLRREHFGFIFQRDHLLAHLTASANVAVPAIYDGVAAAERRLRADALLTRLGLVDRLDHRPHQLSGGQRQRVSIARALVNGGEVILADEPTGSLDSRSGEEVLAVLHELHALGHTVIIVTHDMNVAAHAGRIIEIHDSEITSDRCNPSARPAQSGASLAPQERARDRARVAFWMNLVEAFRIAWIAIISHPLRTCLTMLGIVIGITSVASMVALGGGAGGRVLELMNAMWTNTITIRPGRNVGDDGVTVARYLSRGDVDALRPQTYVDSISPSAFRSLIVRHGNVAVRANVQGVGELEFRVQGVKISKGRTFRAEEVDDEAQVAVVDSSAARRLFGTNRDPIGEIILAGTLPLKVIGVTEDPALSQGPDIRIWIPYSTAGGRLFGQLFFGQITVRVRDGASTASAESDIEHLLMARHGAKDFYTQNMEAALRSRAQAQQSVRLLVLLVAVISLIVGGIGVMNIMLVSVTERTHEIGVRIAVGARRREIMLQFVVEAVVVCMISGVIGIMLSFAAGPLFALAIPDWTMEFSPRAILLAFLCSVGIGIVFGYLPARRAARLDPISALAHE